MGEQVSKVEKGRLSVFSEHKKTWGPFLESPGNFTGPKSNIQNEI